MIGNTRSDVLVSQWGEFTALLFSLMTSRGQTMTLFLPIDIIFDSSSSIFLNNATHFTEQPHKKRTPSSLAFVDIWCLTFWLNTGVKQKSWRAVVCEHWSLNKEEWVLNFMSQCCFFPFDLLRRIKNGVKKEEEESQGTSGPVKAPWITIHTHRWILCVSVSVVYSAFIDQVVQYFQFLIHSLSFQYLIHMIIPGQKVCNVKKKSSFNFHFV